MYNLIESLIDHVWVTQNAGDQQYIYYIVGALIIIMTVTFIDLVYRLIRGICKKGVF